MLSTSFVLRKIRDNIKSVKGREQKKYESGRGVRTRDDRVGGSSSRYGTDRERYNGRGGGRVFKWYTRNVFNKYLSQLKVSETTCTERQCMLALAATSDELRKYDMVTENLTPFAGPQCYPHLDPKSVDYRVHANQRLKTEGPEEKEDESVAEKQRKLCGAVVKDQCWLTCDRCGKRRCVAEASVPVLRGFEFFNASPLVCFVA